MNVHGRGEKRRISFSVGKGSRSASIRRGESGVNHLCEVAGRGQGNPEPYLPSKEERLGDDFFERGKRAKKDGEKKAPFNV